MVGWARVEATNRSSQLISAVSAIDQAIRTQYANEYSYTGLTVDAIASHLPADLRPPACSGTCPAGTVRSPYGGTITVTGRGIGMRQFEIRISAPLPADGCADLATRMGGQYWSVSRGSATMKSASMAAIPAATASAACSANLNLPLSFIGT